VNERPSDEDRRLAGRLQLADRLGVVDEIGGRHLVASLEEPPPGWPRLAPVVFEQLSCQPSRRAGRRPLDEGLPQRLAFPVGGEPVLSEITGREGVRPRNGFESLAEKPVAQRQRRATVLLVVGGDRLQSCSIARLHPVLVLEHGERPAAHTRTSLEAGQLFDLLERIPWHPGAKPLADDLVQVDEDLSTQQSVHGILSRRIYAHELGDGRRLVSAVVIDVQVGVTSQALVQKIDERLEA
jgi:hypothetical protein